MPLSFVADPLATGVVLVLSLTVPPGGAGSLGAVLLEEESAGVSLQVWLALGAVASAFETTGLDGLATSDSLGDGTASPA